MIKINKKPFIIEDCDEMGLGLGTYKVNECVGYVEDSFWAELYKFENYRLTEDGMAEISRIAKFLDDGGHYSDVYAPVMHRALGKSKSIIWQFNLKLNETDDEIEPGIFENECVRTFASFDTTTFYVWTEAHEEEAYKLQKQCDKMNAKAT